LKRSPKKCLPRLARGIEFDRQLLLIVASGVEAHVRIQRAKIRVTANVVPMSMRKEDSSEFWQIRRVRSQRL
jgi:hypothetical protein